MPSKKKPTKSKSKSKPQAKLKAAPKKAAAKKTAPKKTVAKTAPKKAAAKKAAPKKAVAPKGALKAAPPKASKAKTDWTGFFSPLDDRVLVMRDGESDRTPGGLFIPDTASSADKPARGVVIAVGRGHRDKKGRLRPLDVQIQDRVLFEKFAGSEIELRGETVVVLREKEVLGIVDGAKR